MTTSILDYLLIRSQIMILSTDAIMALYEDQDSEFFLTGLSDILTFDDFLLLDEEYIDRVLDLSNRFRLDRNNSNIRKICNDIVLSLNDHLLKFDYYQRLAMRDRYLELQRSIHKIDKYEKEFGINFIKELLKDEYVNIISVADGLDKGAYIYDSNGNVLKKVDVVREKDNIDLSTLGLGDTSSEGTYWYLSSYNFTFTMGYLVDKLRVLGDLDVRTLEFIKTLLELAEEDKKKNWKNYIEDEDYLEPSIVLRTSNDVLTPFVDCCNKVFECYDKGRKKITSYKVNNYCSKKTKMLIKEIDREIRHS